jgi:hypothetical protein
MTFASRAAAALAAGCVLMSASAASAAITVTYPIAQGDPDTLPAGQVLIADFNSDVVNNLTPTPYAYPTLVGGYSMTLEGATVGYNEGGSGYSGTLDGDNTPYLTVIPGGSAILGSVGGFRALSFYMGSPDTYNYIDIDFGGGNVVTLGGTDLTNGDTNQSWSWGKRINLDFGGDVAHAVTFRSTNYSFELDNIAVTAVPEPATWAMMILGFGAAGAMMRRRRALAA